MDQKRNISGIGDSVDDGKYGRFGGWKHVWLPSMNHFSLYTAFFGYGAQVIHRPNSRGEIELFYCAKNEEELQIFEQAFQFGIQLAKDEHTHFQINLLVWDREDLPPYEIPFIFNLEVVEDRYSACAFVEQEKIPLILLRKIENQLLMVKCKAFTWTEEMRETMRDWLREGISRQDAFAQSTGRGDFRRADGGWLGVSI